MNNVELNKLESSLKEKLNDSPNYNINDLFIKIKLERNKKIEDFDKLFIELSEETKTKIKEIRNAPIVLTFGNYSCKLKENKISYYIRQKVYETLSHKEYMDNCYYDYYYIRGGFGNRKFLKYSTKEPIFNIFSVKNLIEFREREEDFIDGNLIFIEETQEIFAKTQSNFIKIQYDTNLNKIKIPTINYKWENKKVSREIWLNN